MTHRSPLVTLVGLVAAFAIMLGMNSANAPAPGAAAPETPAPTATTAAPTPPTATAPSPTPSPTVSTTPTPEAEAQFPDQVAYAGRTRDRSTAVAVAVRGDRAAAYVCDGDDVESWLRGTVDGNTVTLRNRAGTTTLRAELDDAGRLEGAVDLDGDELDFALRPAKPPAGLYRARGTKTTIGWILLPDGSQVGIARTGEESAPAPQLDPDHPEVTVAGEPLSGAPVAGDQDL